MISIISGLRGVNFNNIHNNDIGLVMHSKSIKPPPKKKIKETVPFMNGSYDFSTIGTNGEVIYSERQITIVFGIPAESKEELQVLYSNALSWLTDTGKQKLVFDVMRDYFFMAEVEETSSFEELMSFGTLTVTFVAEPFKYSTDYVGDNIWDTFNFEEDYLQSTEYNIVNTAAITINNPGRLTSPIINCSSAMTLIKSGKSYSLKVGDNKLYGFRLSRGSNTLTINGTGNIKFIFRKESL